MMALRIMLGEQRSLFTLFMTWGYGTSLSRYRAVERGGESGYDAGRTTSNVV